MRLLDDCFQFVEGHLPACNHFDDIGPVVERLADRSTCVVRAIDHVVFLVDERLRVGRDPWELPANRRKCAGGRDDARSWNQTSVDCVAKSNGDVESRIPEVPDRRDPGFHHLDPHTNAGHRSHGGANHRGLKDDGRCRSPEIQWIAVREMSVYINEAGEACGTAEINPSGWEYPPWVRPLIRFPSRVITTSAVTAPVLTSTTRPHLTAVNLERVVNGLNACAAIIDESIRTTTAVPNDVRIGFLMLLGTRLAGSAKSARQPDRPTQCRQERPGECSS